MNVDSKTITIRPLSKVFVWSGDTLYLNADYYSDGRKLVIIDIEKALRDGVRDIRSALNEKYTRELQGNKLSFPYQATPPNNILMIHNNIIPASEVKGLIRTALLSTLTNTQDVVDALNQFNQPFHMGRADPKRVADNVEKKLKYTIRMDRRVFIYDAMKTLLISDPETSNVKLDIAKIEVKEYQKVIAEQYVVAFVGGELRYNAKILKPSNYFIYRNSIDQVDAKVDWKKIITALRDFSQYVLNSERQKASSARQTTYLEFLNKLKIEDECVPIMIGRFTTHVVKTVKVDPQTEGLRSRIMSSYYNHTWDSRTLKLSQGVGVGWIQMCIK